ncbi:unnamed protein product [marine sediment metagenome]|uniref:Uncharacterized protein n=1 Tax=marine sediment metagenome TaxID=412755 RepID=X1RNT0_9ZZZZ
MANEKEQGKTAAGLVVGGMGGTVLGTLLGMLLAAKPAEAAPPDEKLNYLMECQTAIVQLLGQLVEGNQAIIGLLQQWLAAQGIPPAEGVEVTVLTPWVAKEPEEIYRYAIRTIGTFYSSKMVDWTRGKRLVIKVESSLNQAVQIQVIGNTVDDMELAIDINGPFPCTANGNISVGLAWDDWHPFIGVRITTAVAPTTGILKIEDVIQE